MYVDIYVHINRICIHVYMHVYIYKYIHVYTQALKGFLCPCFAVDVCTVWILGPFGMYTYMSLKNCEYHGEVDLRQLILHLHSEYGTIISVIVEAPGVSKEVPKLVSIALLLGHESMVASGLAQGWLKD